MHADDRIIDYMKERNRYAATAACAAAVQLFALAVYLCIYALIAGGVFYSLSEKGGKIFAAAVCAVIAAGLVIFNICCVIKGKKVDITRPDSIAIRDSSEVVRLAYRTARPVLIYKITWWLVILAASPLVYIILVTAMDDQTLAPVYAKIIIYIIGKAAQWRERSQHDQDKNNSKDPFHIFPLSPNTGKWRRFPYRGTVTFPIRRAGAARVSLFPYPPHRLPADLSASAGASLFPCKYF